jgi:peroxiredoxin
VKVTKYSKFNSQNVRQLLCIVVEDAWSTITWEEEAKREVKVLESLAKKEEWLEEYRTRMMRLEVDLVVEISWEVHSWTLWLSTWTPA